MAQSHQGLTGAATSIGEQPLKGLVDPAAMARMALGEAMTNLVWAAATSLADIKASVNWMCALSHPDAVICPLPAMRLVLSHMWGSSVTQLWALTIN